MKFTHPRIVTRNVPALVQFYKDITGMTPIGSDVYAQLRGPQLNLAISSQDIIDRHSAAAATAGSNRSMILDFEVADVDAEFARLRDLVGEFVLEPTTQPWGNRSMLFRDPDGNLINFFSPVADAASPPAGR